MTHLVRHVIDIVSVAGGILGAGYASRFSLRESGTTCRQAAGSSTECMTDVVVRVADHAIDLRL